MKPLERAKVEQEKAQREIKHLENRQKILLNKKADAERKDRTHRLIERGAILENVFPSVIHLSNEEVKAFLANVSQLSEVQKLLTRETENGGVG